jgi:hypothetical protein
MSTKVVAPKEGRTILDRFVVFKLFGADTGGALSVVEHVLEPGTLAAPMHTHRDEDEYSYVLEPERSQICQPTGRCCRWMGHTAEGYARLTAIARRMMTLLGEQLCAYIVVDRNDEIERSNCHVVID